MGKKWKEPIEYSKGFKYQLRKDHRLQTYIYGFTAKHHFFELSSDGFLLIRRGYAWDGATNPAIDTKSIMKPSLVHDVFFQMFRMNILPRSVYYSTNKLLIDMCDDNDMWIVYLTLVKISTKTRAMKRAADPKNKKKILTAP